MKRSPSPTWAPRYSYSDALVNDLCAVAEARARVELLPLPADESLRLRHAAYQRSTRSSTRIEGNPLDDQAMWFAVSSTTAQDWLRQWQEQGLLEPARPGQRIRTWRLREPWQQWVLGQPLQRE